jgi:hypothetical protein
MGYRFLVEMISRMVWLYGRFCLGYPDMEEPLFAPGSQRPMKRAGSSMAR